jgi:hypothetical protein
LSRDHGASPTFDKATRTQKLSFTGDTLVTTGSPVKTGEGDILSVNEWKRLK